MIVRHGTSTYNEAKRVAGWIDAPLAPAGWELARRLREALADVTIDAVYSSTLRRAAETAAATAASRGLVVRRREALREQCLGVLEGRYRDERDPEAAALWALRAEDRAGATTPGAEAFATLVDRVRAGLEDILPAHAEESILIVGHRVANRAMLGALLGLPSEVAAGLRLRSRAVYHLTPDRLPTSRKCPFDPRAWACCGRGATAPDLAPIRTIV